MPTGQTALILPVPEADPVVQTWRARFDKHAAQGVPAHITLLTPFLPLAAARAALPQLRSILGGQPPRFSLRVMTRWDGLAVLCPEPSAWFSRVSQSLCRRWGLLPYGGKHGDSAEPHLTVAYGAEVPAITRARFDAIEQDISRHLPLSCVGRQVQLLAHDGRGWVVAERIRLPVG